jgi:ABC-type Fe3+ transport system permease subunit
LAALPGLGIALPVIGYASGIVRSPGGWPAMTIDGPTALASILEPVSCAWAALFITVVCAFAARRSDSTPLLLSIGLLLFCVPAAIYAVGWLALGQLVRGVAVSPSVAHISRGVALAALGFAVGYSRLPQSIEDAAALVPVHPVKRAFVFVLPLLKWPLAATAALIAALTYADRDVASLLLPPGASRLTLNLYLASANAPSSTIGALAIVAILGAAVTVGLAAMGPMLLWRWRE